MCGWLAHPHGVDIAAKQQGRGGRGANVVLVVLVLVQVLLLLLGLHFLRLELIQLGLVL